MDTTPDEMAKTGGHEIQSMGGKARAESLTPEKRQDIARRAAQARWDNDVLSASHEGTIKLATGNVEIAAAVLPNGKRLLTQSTFNRAIGRSRTPKAGTGVLTTVDGIPFFLQAEILKPFLTSELTSSTTPIFFRDRSGRKLVGYDAQLLPMVGEVYLKMRDAHLKAGKPVPRQYQHIVEACDVLMRGLARVGIIALVDEATGYQDIRDRIALQKILDTYLQKEFAAWAKRFPDEFYMEIFRLKGWPWRGMKVNRPQVVAHYTTNLVYARLAPGILRELEDRNPSDDTGHRKVKHHQWLTENVGHPALAQHLYGIIGLMRAANQWDQFMAMVERAYPKRGDTLLLFDLSPSLQKKK